MDESTKKEIRRVAAVTLRDADLVEPPLSVERLLEHVDLYRDYYSLSDPSFLDRAKHKLQIKGRKLIDIINRVQLKAALLFDERRIVIDSDLPKIKHPWASCHETGHRILPWHKPFFFGDTAETLDPYYQADLEDEAHYAAARLMFFGDLFTKEAKDVAPTIEGLKGLSKRYHSSLTATLRRYVEQGPEIAMAMVVSTPSWNNLPADQTERCRHFVPSPMFAALFPGQDAEALRVRIDQETSYRRGGIVGEFEFELLDIRDEPHSMRAWSFNNQHYLLSLIVEERQITESRIVIPFAGRIRGAIRLR